VKRLLFDIHYPTFGGPHNQAVQLAEPLRRRGWETLVLLPDEPGNAAERLREAGVEVVQQPLVRIRVGADPRLHARFVMGVGPEIARTRRLLRDRRIDVVLIAGLYTVQTAIAARLEGIPVVWQILDTFAPQGVRRVLMPAVTRLADVVMTTGMVVARGHPGAANLGDRLVPYFPPVDTAQYRPDADRRNAARRAWGIPEGATVIGTVGNLNRVKGQQYLIRAAEVIHRTDPDVYVRILGAFTPTHAAHAEALREEAKQRGLLAGDRLAFVDPGRQVANLLPGFDVFLLTSVPRSEGVPTAILEAMSSGLPVVATRVGGVEEVVEDGVTGFVVAPLDVDAIAAATRTLVRQPHLRTRFGASAREHAVKRFGIERCADAHLCAFERATARHPTVLHMRRPGRETGR